MRLYRGRPLSVWQGKVKVSDIEGWTDNPRIELAKTQWKQKFGDREPTQDELFDLMKSDREFKLDVLRDDIMRNGLREPLTLAFNGKLLDGNRRFFALLYVLEKMKPENANRVDFETVNAYALTEGATALDEEHVLVEENFSPPLKLEWPPYVKAKRILEELEAGKNVPEIASKFNWTTSKVKETKRIGEIIDNFEAFAKEESDPNIENGGGLGLSEAEAQAIAATNYEFFNEAQKSFYHQVTGDLDFQIQFFHWIQQGKFKSFPEVRVAYKIYKNAEARSYLMSDEPNAGKTAKATIDYNEKIVGTAEEAEGRIGSFLKFLKQLKIDEVQKLPPGVLADLEAILTSLAKFKSATPEP